MKKLSQILLEEKKIEEQNKVIAPTDSEPLPSGKGPADEKEKESLTTE